MPLLTVDQAAERLVTSPRFIRRHIAERRIAFAKLGKHVRIDSADLDSFVAGRTCRSGGAGCSPGEPGLDNPARARAAPGRRPVLTPGRACGQEDDRGPNVGYKTVNRGLLRPTRANIRILPR